MKFQWGKMACMLSVAIATVFAAPSSHADLWNKKTIVHLENSFIIPGTPNRPYNMLELAEGNYVLKLMDSPSSRNVVMVYSADERKFISFVLAIHAWRTDDKITDDAQLIFERNEDGQMVLKKWFFAGENAGLEFVYRGGRKGGKEIDDGKGGKEIDQGKGGKEIEGDQKIEGGQGSR